MRRLVKKRRNALLLAGVACLVQGCPAPFQVYVYNNTRDDISLVTELSPEKYKILIPSGGQVWTTDTGVVVDNKHGLCIESGGNILFYPLSLSEVPKQYWKKIGVGQRAVHFQVNANRELVICEVGTQLPIPPTYKQPEGFPVKPRQLNR